MSSLEDLEAKIRERGVRVEERLELLRDLALPDAPDRLSARQERILAALRAAADKLKGTAG